MKRSLAILSLSFAGFVGTTSAALDISLTAPDLNSSVINVTVTGTFESTLDTTVSSVFWRDIGDAFLPALNGDTVTFDSIIEITNPNGPNFGFDRIYLDNDSGSGDDFRLYFDSNPGVLAGLSYSVDGSTTIDIDYLGATFSDLIRGVYNLPAQTPWSPGHTLTIALQAIPEPSAAVFAGVAVFGFILARRRSRAADKD